MRFLFVSILVLTVSPLVFSSEYNWEWQNPKPLGNCLTAVYAFDQDIAIIGGENGTLMRTVNGGKDWHVKHLNHDISGWIRKIHCNDSGAVWFSYYGKFVKSINKGETWDLLELPYEMEVIYCRSDTIYGIGRELKTIVTETSTTKCMNYFFCKSYDMAVSWETMTIPGIICGGGMPNSFFFNSKEGIIAGNSGTNCFI